MVQRVERSNLENKIFLDFPYCQVELLNCQWQVIYHGLMWDVQYLISEPSFSQIPMNAETWIALVFDMDENKSLLDAVKSFATASCPKLVELIPLLENFLHLRTVVHQKKTKEARKLIESLPLVHKATIERHNFSVVLENELKAAEMLISKLEFERALDMALELSAFTSYSYDGPNEQPPYAKFCAVTEPIHQLQKAIDDFSVLGQAFNSELERKLKFAKAVLKGRKLLTRSEEDKTIDWDDALFDYENSIADTCSSPSVQSDGTADGYTVLIPSFFAPEYNVTVQELVRRVLLAGFKEILKATCVHGKIDIDVRVDETALAPLFIKFNSFSRMMQMNHDHLPVNVKCLYSFTGIVLKIRKAVLEDNWGAAFTAIQLPHTADGRKGKEGEKDRDGTVRALLNKSKTVNHGGGLGIPELVGELELVRAELQTKDSVLVLIKELQTIVVTIPEVDEQRVVDQLQDLKALSISQTAENASDSGFLPTVDMSSLKDAMKAVRGNSGEKSKKLHSLAMRVTSIVDLLLSDRCSSVSQEDLQSIVNEYKLNNVDSSALERVFKTVRIHSFMEHVYFSLRDLPHSSDLFASLSELQKSVKTMPPKFVPWLKAAYHFCELLSGIESYDWIRIVECAKNLEDSVTFLLSLRSQLEGDNKKYEKSILKLLSEKASAGYKLAISMKAREDGRVLTTTGSSSSTPEIDSNSALKTRLRTEDEREPYGITQLRRAGYKDSDIVDLKLPLKYLWAFDVDPILLRRKGYGADKLRSAGYSLNALYNAGFTVEQLKNIGCSALELKAVGATADQLRVAGFDEKQLIREELSVDVMKAMEYVYSLLSLT